MRLKRGFLLLANLFFLIFGSVWAHGICSTNNIGFGEAMSARILGSPVLGMPANKNVGPDNCYHNYRLGVIIGIVPQNIGSRYPFHGSPKAPSSCQVYAEVKYNLQVVLAEQI